MQLLTLSRFKNLKGKRVLLRVDFNVPIDAKGKIDPEGEQRLRTAVPTVQHLIDGGAKVIIVSHLGRPKGWEDKLSLEPAVKRFAKIIGQKILFVDDCLEDDVKVDNRLKKMKDGDIAALENIRFYKGEDKNDSFFARRLASLADIYVNDAFAVDHRAAASTVGVTKFLPCAAGLLVEKEVKALSRLFDNPKRPLVVLMGGTKISTKLPTIKKMCSIADKVLLGGGINRSFIAARGLEAGLPPVSKEDAAVAKSLLGKKNIQLATDVVVTKSEDGSVGTRVVPVNGLEADDMVMDIGPESVRAFAAVLKTAKTIVWNGPVGAFEIKMFSHGSVALGRVIAARSSGKCFGVVGGGETVACLAQTGMAEYVDHVSTGGGAMLEFLEGKVLPGIKPLLKK